MMVQTVKEAYVNTERKMIFMSVQVDGQLYEVGTPDGRAWSTIHDHGSWNAGEATAQETVQKWVAANPDKMRALVEQLERLKTSAATP
jgi:hypothetical protein